MPHAGSWIWSAALSLCAAAAGVPAQRVDAQLPVPQKYRAEAEAAARSEGVTTDISVPVDQTSDADNRAARRAADSIAATTPQSTPLIQGTVEISRGAFRERLFEVPPGLHCNLTGNADGTGRPFDVLVFPALDVLAWRADPHAGKPLWQSMSTKAATLAVPLPDAGKYDLVIPNRTAWFLARTVTVKAGLLCTRDWPPS